MREQPWL